MDDGTFTNDTKIRHEQTYVICPECYGNGIDIANFVKWFRYGEAGKGQSKFYRCKRCQGTGEIVN
jgi:DnaJ-class molecular chaperone